MHPLMRNPLTDAMYKDEAGYDHGPDIFGFSRCKFSYAVLPGRNDPPITNPLYPDPDRSAKLAAPDDITGLYLVFVPPVVVQECQKAESQSAARPHLKVTLFFSPFPEPDEMFTFGLRSIFAARSSERRVLISIPGAEGYRPPKTWGIGISSNLLQELLTRANAGYCFPEVSVLAAWSAGWKGMVATMRASGRVQDLPDLSKVDTVVFYDCLYFTGDSSGLVDSGLANLSKASGAVPRVITYLATPGGNDSLKPFDVLNGIPFLKKNGLSGGLIPLIVGANLLTLRKISLVRTLSWAMEEGAIMLGALRPTLDRACRKTVLPPRHTIRSAASLPFGKGAPAQTIDLRTFARDPKYAFVQQLSNEDVSKAGELVNSGMMIFSGDMGWGGVDHFVLMPEIGWEFIAG